MSDGEFTVHLQRGAGRVHIGFKDSTQTDGVSERGEVLASPRSHAAALRMLEDLGVAVLRHLSPLPAVLATVTPEQLRALRESPLVDYVEPDALGGYNSASRRTASSAIAHLDEIAASYDSIPWQISRVNAPAAWSVAQGVGVKLLLIDAGADPNHPDLSYAAVTGACDTRDQSPLDIWHGVRVAGVAGARLNNQLLAGVAPAVSLLSSRVRHPTASIWVSEAICSVQWGRTQGAQVINMSWGLPTTFTSLSDQLNYSFWIDDVVLVAAAGNDSGQPVQFPANVSTVIAVSGTNQADSLWHMSNVGIWTEIAAPASSMTLLGRTFGGDPTFVVDSGTSFSAPAVAGAAAVLRSHNSGWSASEIRRRLAVGAQDLGTPGRDFKFGYGLLNVAASLSANPPSPASLSLIGPETVRPGATCSWQASIDGGEDPFEFSWTAGYTPISGTEWVE